MNQNTLSGPTLELIERLQSSPVLRAVIADRPQLFTNFIRIAEVSARLSSDRARFVATLTRAADASDRVVETILSGGDVHLPERLLLAARMFQDFGDAIEEFFPVTLPSSVDETKAPN